LTIFLYGLSVATLGAMGLQRLLDWMNAGAEQMAKTRKVMWISAAVLGVLALLQSAGAITNVWQSLFEVGAGKVDFLDANMANMRLGFWLSFLIAAAVAGIVELMARRTIGWRSIIVAFSLIAALDVARVDRPFIRGTVLLGRNPPPALFESDETIRFLQDAAARGEVFRVFNAGYDTNVLATHGIEQVAGHHPNDLGRYRALIGGEEVANASLPLLDLINASYLVAGQRMEQVPPGFEEAFAGPRSVVYRNRNALPRAYLAGRTEVVPDPGAVARLLDPGFDRRTTVLLPEALPMGVSVQPDPQGAVTWAERGINESTLRVTTDRPALLVLSENYYPAWKVEVDGAATPLFRANYTFRAVPVPAGEHTVRFHYESDVLKASASASIAILLVLIAVGLIGLIRREPSATGSA
ncbi:MAG: YfhO family protein, partial [Longimicrobiales bacterium]